MTQEQIDSIKAEIAAGIEGAASVASAVAPQYVPLILLGKSVAKLIGPAAFEDIVLLVQKAAPTADEAMALAKEIAGLAHPESL